MEWVEFTARTLEEAKDLALDRLGVAADGLRAITCEANVLTTVEAINSSTQRQSTQP